MTPPPADKRRVPPPDGATLPPTAAMSRPAGAPAGNEATMPVFPDVPPELVDHPRYRVLKLLGQGGMGAVYLAEHLVMGRRVALKTISAQFLANREAVGRFHREIRAAAKLHHPNVVAAYDADQAGGLHFLVMEFVDGLTVANYARRKGPLPPDQACAIVSQAALGLQHAHEQGLIHRDVKPSNLMLTHKGQVKVLDFGLARFARQEEARDDAARTATGAVLGTADYIAPEQTNSGHKVDIRADVYSLGCTLYYLLVGRVPFPDGTMIDKFVQHATKTPPALASLRPELPPGLVAVVERMMAKRPEDRFQTPGDVARALRPFTGRAEEKTQALADGGGTAGIARAPRGGPRRKRIVVAIAAAGLVAVLLVLGLIFSGSGDPSSRSGGAAATATPRATDPGSRLARSVSWTGKGPTHAIVDQPRFLKDILDFQDLTGANLKEFRDWQAALGKDFRVSFLSNRSGVGPPLFNAVAVRERAPVIARVFTSLTDDEAGKTAERLQEDKLDLSFTGHCGYWDAESGTWRNSQLWAGAPFDGYLWILSLPDLMTTVQEAGRGDKRPFALDAMLKGGDGWFIALGTRDPAVKWKVFWALNREELVSTVEQYRDQGWRPDALAPYWDGERFRFMLVVRDNPEPVDWLFRTDMTLADYKKTSAEQKRQGLFPLLVTSYGDEADVHYAAVWVRYRVLE